MIFKLTYKIKQFFFGLIKLSIVIGAFYFIYQKLVNNPELDFRTFIGFLSKKDIFSLKNTLLLFFLTFFNWFFEIKKWQILVSSIKKISFKNAFEQSLGSLTASLFTPNRIGEYGAKAIYYISNYRKRILLINLLGNVLQMSITTVFGVIGLYFFVFKYQINISYNKFALFLLLGILIIPLIIFGVQKTKFTIKGFSLKKIKHFILQFPKKTLVFALFLSMLRYFVFSFQFYFILQLFGTEISYFDAMIVITSMYLLASIIPSIFIFDVIIKGSVAIYLFGLMGFNDITILSTITLMWLLNFVLPSLFGSYYVINFNLPKEN
ncbi:lysylphosphatidylglycerol synthase domain-containing protein [Flavivirga abyssicola]|uniref:lysylphosphatidylglycerol synthase domain-containing protein n=1 Tax=Flavivirga abyssicola TaxID=3063533 RepID=UPI0026E09D18|nr:lysylphosphatidylglycerol synthase domain-containing protein [Flavivirga sp. MEBiC07777]WVK11634.1 lysylphosphatidylglycerol synthase domain-containing protein [Flavivirga sp. MEBiC07777]